MFVTTKCSPICSKKTFNKRLLSCEKAFERRFQWSRRVLGIELYVVTDTNYHFAILVCFLVVVCFSFSPVLASVTFRGHKWL